MNKDDLQSRREFFKSTAKKALPVLGAIALSQVPFVSDAHESHGEMGCFSGCSGGCSDGCYTGCQTSCDGDCYGGCRSTCSGSCDGYCAGSCSGTCAYSSS